MAKIISPVMIEKFIEMYIMGTRMSDIAETLGVDRSTLYLWKEREDVKVALEARQKELKNQGTAFIKSKYIQYLQNIDKLCNNFDDKRTALAANQWMLEKMDGKATTKLSVETEIKEVKAIDDDTIEAELKEAFEEE